MSKRYTEYVDSGVPWLGDIPTGWTMRPLWSMFERIKDTGHPDEQMLSVFRDYGVVAKDSRDNINKTAENRNIYQLVHPGWLVTNRMKAWQGSVGISGLQGIVSGHYICFAPRHDADSRYLNWLFRSPTYAAGYALQSRGVRIGQAEIDNDLYRAMPVLLPQIEEQRAIADYLDRETARIDTLIEEQQRLIEMLRERRVATIAEALDGYEMTRLRRLVNHKRPMTYGILQCGEPVDGGVAYVGPSDIIGEGVSPERDALRTTTPEIASAYQRSVLAGGDVVVSIGPAYGKVAVVSDDLTGANLTQDTVRVALRPDLVDTRFVVWALLSRQTSEYWDYQIMGATFRRLNLGTLARTPIPLPSIDAQRSIAAYLDQQTAKIDVTNQVGRFGPV
ncbi:restriction endonuclease subunit S [Micromonospora sp. WMMD1102]|uniref:restriction endonuclease subunit S n=1 Tax=Micromonospora sp. WMMD1102 TaxID=3016105 RepID=UPI002415723C|nr:restriction endonuclease subunit S [Micromonospora sp. WMMD1102]MDG4787147.1 restriction endonuclease subunit S [Micromonospora sp. WMMD1102]